MTDMSLFTVDENDVVVLSLKNINRLSSGPSEALQFVMVAFFTDVGSCHFARQDGGDALEDLTRGKSALSKSDLRVTAAFVVKKTFDTVRLSQGVNRSPNATVVGIDLIDAYGDGTGKIMIKIRIRLLSGNSFNVIIPSEQQQ